MREPRTITLNKSIASRLTRAELRAELRQHFRYVRVDIDERAESLQIIGPNTYYYGADPDLVDVCSQIFEEVTSAGILGFRERRTRFDLCLEDTWTYFFVQSCLEYRSCQTFDLLHLDDHSDMTAPLLSRFASGLVDIPRGAEFDPASAESIEAAIFSGAIGIGSFLTPLFHHHENVRVSHLCNVPRDDVAEYSLVRECAEIPLVEGVNRISVRRAKRGEEGEDRSTYAVAGSIASLLDRMQSDKLIVHVDLDYFINDYDGGNSPGLTKEQETTAILAARRKLSAFFRGMRSLDRPVARWIVATSPGFCAARHWNWLINEIDSGIEQLEA